jgi:25S rRNA (uracil2843-N3)-methyltransferase
MFTLNELYSTSLAGTQRFLLSLTASIPPGALLLIVDSPGSYSTVTLNHNEKQYPMLWLLEHTLFNTAPKSFHAQALAATEIDSKEESTSPQQKRNVRFEEEITPLWGRVKSEESKWCRLPEELNYPIELEDMRYQMHLYRRL